MSILKKALNSQAFAKVGMLGFPGSGKTFTATEMAIGICGLTKNNKVAYFDTETGSDFLIKKLEAAGIETFQVKSTSFNDLCDTIKACVDEKIGCLIIDSITHVWRGLCESYDKKLRRNGRLQFQDWALIKGEWKRYTDLYVNSPLHIIVCGRSGYEYDYDFNEDGSKDLIKTATRMKVESEFAFEPSLVIEMERTSESKEDLKEIRGKTDHKSKSQKQQNPSIGSKWIHKAYILKDRTDTMNGQDFDNPTFEQFKPHFLALNLGGEHIGVDLARNNDSLFTQEGKPNWKKDEQRRSILIEEIEGEFNMRMGNSGDDKKARCALKKHFLGTYSETAINEMKTSDLEKGLAGIKDLFAKDDIKVEVLRIIEEETNKARQQMADDRLPM